ncbi:protein TRACHEARY ELEMENT DIFFERENTIATION-RELATED 7A-like [Vicia villosa]|uniref:protein TRACHEARY ELEMENT DIFFERENTIATION-RELATED 7A-like n=1 Tax=Vicia villosa TaxID=3911 RepID=UPI00273C3725|nr:protein TRACHEARY ELEMENT DIFFERENTIATION-RELATED 7A-like [Vicia villosa]
MELSPPQPSPPNPFITLPPPPTRHHQTPPSPPPPPYSITPPSPPSPITPPPPPQKNSKSTSSCFIVLTTTTRSEMELSPPQPSPPNPFITLPPPPPRRHQTPPSPPPPPYSITPPSPPSPITPPPPQKNSKSTSRNDNKCSSNFNTLLRSLCVHPAKFKEREASEILKEVTTPPALALPDFTQEFVIENDALGNGLGAILLQQGWPMCFLQSKALSDHNLTKYTFGKKLMERH